MRKKQILNRTIRIGLFTLILSLGTMVALIAGETKGLALPKLSDASVQAITTAAHGDVVYASMTGGPQPTGVYRSDDHGRTWQVVSPGPGVAVTALAVHPTNEAVLYAGTGRATSAADNLWFSNNGGQTWHRFPLGLPVNPEGMIPGVTALAVDPNQPGRLYVGTGGHGVYRFEAGRDGYGYQLIGGVSLYDAHVNSLVIGSDSRVYALTNDGLFTIDGDAWRKLSLPEQAVVSLAVAPDDPQRLYAGGASTGLYRSIDGARTWERINSGLDMIPGAALRVTGLAVDEGTPNHVLAATVYGVGNRFGPGNVYESRDAGHSWTRVATVDGMVTQLTVNQGIIYAGTADGLARYGEPTKPASDFLLPAVRLLVHPTGAQVLILILTVVLAGLALIGRTEWVSRTRAQTAQS